MRYEQPLDRMYAPHTRGAELLRLLYQGKGLARLRSPENLVILVRRGVFKAEAHIEYLRGCPGESILSPAGNSLFLQAINEMIDMGLARRSQRDHRLHELTPAGRKAVEEFFDIEG